MNSKREALKPIMGKLAKLLPLLASDKSGEVTNAADRIVRLLATVKLDWHDLVALLDQEAEPLQMRNSFPFETDPEALMRLASSASYFLDAEREVFADISMNGCRQTWPLASPQYSEWLMRSFWLEKARLAADGHMKNVLRLLRAQTRFSDAVQHNVHLRVAEADEKIYLDLADDTWRAVEISAAGWRIVDAPPVRFRRPAGMQALPLPVCGGNINELRPFINLGDADFLLVVAFLLDTLRVGRPHPVLYLAGGEGTAKSTLTQLLAGLVDPGQLKLRGLPRLRDLFVAAHNQTILCFDNVSKIPPEVSDGICQLASGAGYAKRKNYTDSDELYIRGSHPVILNGIENCIDRPDLADRAVIITLPRVDAKRRRSDVEFWTAFNSARPRILGALLDIAVRGLGRQHEIRMAELVRVADFQRWAIACEPAFAQAGDFERAFKSNVSNTVENLLDVDPVAKAIAAFMLGRTAWKGTAAQLLAKLVRSDPTEARVTRLPAWPRDPARLSKALRSMQATLAKAGIMVNFGKAVDRRRTRIIELSTMTSEYDSRGEMPSVRNEIGDEGQRNHEFGR